MDCAQDIHDIPGSRHTWFNACMLVYCHMTIHLGLSLLLCRGTCCSGTILLCHFIRLWYLIASSGRPRTLEAHRLTLHCIFQLEPSTCHCAGLNTDRSNGAETMAGKPVTHPGSMATSIEPPKLQTRLKWKSPERLVAPGLNLGTWSS